MSNRVVKLKNLGNDIVQIVMEDEENRNAFTEELMQG
ncbi:MAG: enoyl-CoA hydratase, partial [Symploca sp. SIO2G7]|nr:enoyl-CoA hydratase [Symploca sp. SIO2G7]